MPDSDVNSMCPDGSIQKHTIHERLVELFGVEFNNVDTTESTVRISIREES